MSGNRRFRVLQAILQRNGNRIPRGHTGPLPGFSDSVLAQLLRREVISEVSPPPLAILPGWKEPAEKLREIGVETVIDFLDAHDETLAEVVDDVEEKKVEVAKWLEPPEGMPTFGKDLQRMSEEASVDTSDGEADPRWGTEEDPRDLGHVHADKDTEVPPLTAEDMAVVHLKGEIAKRKRGHGG